ncbi:NADPH-dependent FMN reductase [Conexibacter arvalis]|uniref:NAD(P)H-dependent FMN reductase n=1 Tax=Conexibacter arvalis TaxID=912552 RepID=A0A840ID91_9ACTN|nr:NAD(P)H-dependent oxidoreductase [Conexibacter arvalis]MBB4661900.1 NAD(P)H-dependent FMN reductase [Conexibacter arvalis]
MPRLLIIVGSTRPGRVGLPVARWFGARAEAHGGFDVDVADLAELDLPLMDEPNHPRLQRYEHDHTKAWSARVAAADAVVLVMPEYNHTFTAPVKNALDYLHHEWQHKPIGIVSYGGVSAGTRAATAIKPVLAALKLTVAGELPIPFVARFVGDDGVVQANETMTDAADGLLDELVRVEATLRDLRHPVAA